MIVPSNALSPIELIPLDRVIDDKLVHPLKAWRPMELTLLGILTDFKFLTLQNAICSIAWRDSGKFTLIS